MSILVGLSVNRELSMTVAPTDAQKVPVQSFQESSGGSSVSIARGLAALGHTVKIFGVVGEDKPEVDRMARQLETEWSLPYVFFPLRSRTPLAVCVIENGHSRVYSYRDAIPDAPAVRKAVGTVRKLVKGVSDLSCTVVSSVRPDDAKLACAMLTSSVNCLRILNPNQHFLKAEHRSLLRQLAGVADIMVVNHHEAAIALDIADGDFSPQQVPELLEFGVPEVVVTWNSRGAYHCSRTTGFLHQPAVAMTEIADSTGAGDSFLAGFISARLAGEDNNQAMLLGTATAAAKIRRIGGYNVPSLDEITAFRSLTQAGVYA